MSAGDVGLLLDDLASLAQPVKLAFRWRPQLPDPGDDMVLETAVNGNADAIVTFNQRDFREATKTFTCDVIFPAEALRRLGRSRQ